ncbi:3024_t:CDS:1, partial [Acaulospora morrowiae]
TPNTNTSTTVHQTDMEIDEQSTNSSQSELTNSSLSTNPISCADKVDEATTDRSTTSSTIEADIKRVNSLDKHSKILEL